MLPNVRFGSGLPLAVKAVYEGGIRIKVSLPGVEPWAFLDQEILDPRYGEADRKRRLRERVRLGVLRVLEEAYSLAPRPWGLLMGVRPTKMVHSMLDRGFSQSELRKVLANVYAAAPEKIELLLTVAAQQRSFFHPNPNQPVSVYVGIPFCPTRCSYCSFASYPLASHGHLFDGFFEVLCQEIKAVGGLLKELKIDVEAIYLGGGTPTTVQGKKLVKLLSLVRQYLTTPATKEMTVEAGRPDTLSGATLSILQEFGTDRISINPQTMQERTLQVIGRGHGIEEIKRAYRLARTIGIPLINTDIILGLPGESVSDVEDTLRQIEALRPDSLTVHGLAVKRASRLKKEEAEVQIAQETGAEMAFLAAEYAAKWGMDPYYLYRQRHTLADLENVGYSLPGSQSIYNVQMMEERQTIIALGGGGITKLVSPDLSLVRHINPKCPATYSQRIRAGLGAKIGQIRDHFLV
ncbi:MAG: coproporphyrinogen dehydrogenase HemZ [Firmicutes bacterium]|nr:coproporphyrinogen dehydrogenase HemZ [Bacillota bacterium]